MSNQKIIGILGGTFDPIHYGHLNIAEFCMHEFLMDQIIFIPCHIPSHRPTPQANSTERLEMLKIATLGYDKFSIDTIEMDKDTESYSYNTLADLRKKFPKESLSFILGMDSFQTLNTWQNYNKILEMCNIIVVNRPSYEIPDTSWSHELLQNHLASSKEEFLQHNYGKIFMISMPPQDVSATQIRNTLKQKSGDLINVPTKVKEYIDQNNLYKIRGSNHSTMDIKKIEQILDDQKAEDINVIDVRNLTSLTDYMIICTARSTRHAAAIGENLAEEMAKSGLKPIGVEGDSQSDWILLDFADFIVHVMLAEARDFYSLEKLWSLTTSARERAERDA